MMGAHAFILILHSISLFSLPVLACFRYIYGVELHNQQKQYVHNSKPVVWILSEAAMELQKVHT